MALMGDGVWGVGRGSDLVCCGSSTNQPTGEERRRPAASTFYPTPHPRPCRTTDRTRERETAKDTETRKLNGECSVVEGRLERPQDDKSQGPLRCDFRDSKPDPVLGANIDIYIVYRGCGDVVCVCFVADQLRTRAQCRFAP
jgi:hypothetical protein